MNCRPCSVNNDVRFFLSMLCQDTLFSLRGELALYVKLSITCYEHFSYHCISDAQNLYYIHVRQFSDTDHKSGKKGIRANSIRIDSILETVTTNEYRTLYRTTHSQYNNFATRCLILKLKSPEIRRKQQSAVQIAKILKGNQYDHLKDIILATKFKPGSNSNNFYRYTELEWLSLRAEHWGRQHKYFKTRNLYTNFLTLRISRISDTKFYYHVLIVQILEKYLEKGTAKTAVSNPVAYMYIWKLQPYIGAPTHESTITWEDFEFCITTVFCLFVRVVFHWNRNFIDRFKKLGLEYHMIN